MTIGIAVTTRNRREPLLASLDQLLALPQRPPIMVIDNASDDGTAEAVRARFPQVGFHRLDRNLGAAARTIAAERLDTEIVAFADDDSWWAPDALDVIAAAFERHPRLGLAAGRVLVGEEEKLDPTCVEMRESPLRDGSPPGPHVLGFVACGAAVRRTAFLEVGGFERRMGVGGEESLLSIDLASAGWELRYLDDAVAHHHPGGTGPRRDRDVVMLRNDLWTTWLRRPAPVAVAATARVAARAHDRTHRRALFAALGELPWALRNRREAPSEVERDLRLLD